MSASRIGLPGGHCRDKENQDTENAEKDENHAGRSVNRAPLQLGPQTSGKEAPPPATTVSASSQPRLVLAPFRQPPCLTFGNVRVGARKQLTVLLDNPHIVTEELCWSMGYDMKGFRCLPSAGISETPESRGNRFLASIPPNSVVPLVIEWSPPASLSGNVRVAVTLRSSTSGQRFQIFLLGFAVCQEQQPTSKVLSKSTRSASTISPSKRKALEPLPATDLSKRRPIVKASSNNATAAPTTSAPTTSLKPLRMGKLQLKTKSKTCTSATTNTANFRPLPYISRADMYDENWIDKQERSFTQWINYELVGGDWALMDHHQNLATGPATSLDRFSKTLKRNHVRQAASFMYQSEAFRVVVDKLEPEVQSGRIAIRKDCNLLADVGIREDLTNMLLGYSPVWLALGLEVVLGKCLPTHDIASLSAIIGKHLLNNELISGRLSPDAGGAKMTVSRKTGLQLELGRYTLKKLLLLILFLDKAKLTRLIPGDPCLFNRDAPCKSSRDLLLRFSHKYLSGEGDLTRHLMFLGYSVTHAQHPMDEYNYAVTNLAMDLRDGIRLARLMEMHTSDFTLRQKLRFPSTGKVQMLHNLTQVFESLQHHGVQLDGIKGGNITAKDIVEGHREKTLLLLWKLIFQCKINVMVDEEALRVEVDRLGRKVVADELLESNQFQSKQMNLLFRWCQLLCTLHGVPMHNFTSSFSDGRAFCVLIGHYHPEILSHSSIHHPRPQKEESDEENMPTSFSGGAQNWAMTFSPGRKKNEPKVNENFRIFNKALLEIGGIPVLLRPSETMMLDEKTVILTVTYLCSRLMVLRSEISAARTIQRAWKRFRLCKLLSQRLHAATVIYNACCKYVQRRRVQKRYQKMQWAATVFQRLWRKRQCAKQARTEWAICSTQAHIRGFLQRRLAERKLVAAMIIQQTYRAYVQRKAQRVDQLVAAVQAHVRGFLVRKCVESFVSDVVRIQAVARGHLARKQVKTQRCYVGLQAHVRGFLYRRQLQLQHYAATRIQARYRGWKVYRQYWITLVATILMQRRYRATLEMRRQRQAYQQQLRSIVSVQSLVRGYLARKRFQQECASRKIQSTWKMYHCRRNFLLTKWAALVVQRRWRAMVAGRQVTHELQLQRNAATTIQRWYRGVQSMRLDMYRYQLTKMATLILQRSWRSYVVRKQKRAATVIQARFRGHIARSAFLERRRAANTIAATFRMHMARRQYLALRDRIVRLQALARGALLRQRLREEAERRRQYLLAFSLRAQEYLACVRIQRCTRRYLALQKARKQVHALEMIQNWWRARLVRMQYLSYLNSVQEQRHAAKIIYDYMVSKLQRQRYLKMKRSALRIQATWRGHVVRRKSSKMLAERRRRIREANALAEEHMKIGNRANAALTTLVESSNLSLVLKACFHLDVATRLSKECCLRLADHHAVDIIYNLIKSCNRSKPHMEVLLHAVNILHHMSVHAETATSIFKTQDAVEVWVELLQNYRETEGIFMTVARMMELQCRYEGSRKLILGTKDAVRRLQNVRNMSERKLALDIKSKKIVEKKSKLYPPAQVMRSVLELLGVVAGRE